MNEAAEAWISSNGRNNYASSLLLLQEQGFQVDTFIDVGAAQGAFFLLRRMVSIFPNARHFFVDAMQENESIYRNLATKFDVGHEIVALSCAEGEVAVRVDPDYYNTHIDHLQPDTKYDNCRRVPMSTLDGIVKRHALRPPFAVKLDVQGGELDVLRGALRTLDDAVAVTAEIQIFTERDTLVELLAFMQGIGWALFDITNQAYFPSNQAFCECYATFIPKEMDFRRQAQWCLPEQAERFLGHLRTRRANNLSAIEELLRMG